MIRPFAGRKAGPDVRRIVVGVDGSAGSLEALRWAETERALHGATLRVLLAWELPFVGPVLPAVPMNDDAWQRAAEKSLAEAMAAVYGPNVPPDVRAEVVSGQPSTVLVGATRDADLLVVGNRGHGGMVGLLIGSVSAACIHHADCPVLVVRPSHHRTGDEPTGDASGATEDERAHRSS